MSLNLSLMVFNLTARQWRKILKWFLRCYSINLVVGEKKLSKYKILKTLNLVRKTMVKDLPDIFEGVVEIDETYLGGQKKNKGKEHYLRLLFSE